MKRKYLLRGSINTARLTRLIAKAIDLADRNLKKQPSSRDHQYVFSRLLHWNASGVLAADNLSDAVVLQMDQALEICRELHRNYPQSEGFDYNLADALRTAALIKAKREDAAVAAGLFDEAVQIAQAYAEDSKNPGKTQLLAEALRDRSAFAQAAGRTADATNDLQAALSAADTASTEVPESKLLQKLKLDLAELQASLAQ